MGFGPGLPAAGVSADGRRASVVTASFDGAVLAGGSSRRMGRDKALIEAPDGRPLALVGVEALRTAGATEVIVVGGDERGLRALGVSWVADLHPGEGPLGGVLTAFANTTAELVVVMACDMPGVDSEVPAALVAALAAAPDSGVAVAVVGEREQPLTACWRRSTARDALRAAFVAGERAPRKVLSGLGVVRVDGLPVSQLADVDSPEDLRRYAEPPPHLPTDEQDAP
jgi:molybdopterin-guanine dinucleotide biosynthesis protein A